MGVKEQPVPFSWLPYQLAAMPTPTPRTIAVWRIRAFYILRIHPIGLLSRVHSSRTANPVSDEVIRFGPNYRVQSEIDRH